MKILTVAFAVAVSFVVLSSANDEMIEKKTAGRAEDFTRDDSGSCGDSILWRYSSDTKTLTITGSGQMTNYGFSMDVPWFNYSHNVRRVIFQGNITSIGDYAFHDCTNLESVTSDGSIEDFGTYGYNIPPSIQYSVTIPSSVTSIGAYAFCGCSKILNVTIISSVESIGDHAFFNCGELYFVNILSSVEKIDNNAFSECTTLIRVEYHGISSPQCGSNVFYGSDQLKTLCISLDYPNTSFCDKTVNTSSVPRRLLRQHNHCYEVFVCISTNDEVGSSDVVKRQNATEWENQTSKCGKYICVNETGKDFIDYCVVNNTQYNCYESKCQDDGTCSNISLNNGNKCLTCTNNEWQNKDCKAEILANSTMPSIINNNTKTCWNVSCSNTSGCELNTNGLDIILGQENHCYEVVCEGTSWILKKRPNATKWESQTSKCGKYICMNKTGNNFTDYCEGNNTLSQCYESKCQENGICSNKSLNTGGNKCLTCTNNGWEEKDCEAEILADPNTPSIVNKSTIKCCSVSCVSNTGQCQYLLDAYNNLKQEENHCYEVVCEGTTWKLKKRDNATRWETQQSKCGFYECKNETGEHFNDYCEGNNTLSQCYESKCQDNGSCSNRSLNNGNKCLICTANGWEEKDCEAEILVDPYTPSIINNDTKTCWNVSCSSTDGCELNTNGLHSILKEENHCYEVVCEETTWKLKKKLNAIEWEKKQDECVEYVCNNESGLIMQSKCKDNGNKTVCVNDTCVEKNVINDENTWRIEITIGENVTYTDLTEILETISSMTEIEMSNIDVWIDVDEEGKNKIIVFIVENEQSANIIVNSVNQCLNETQSTRGRRSHN